MLMIRKRVPEHFTTARLYVPSSTSSTPLSAKQGQWVFGKIHPTLGGVYYEVVSNTGLVPDGMIYKNPEARFGGQEGRSCFAKPWQTNGLSVPAYTIYDRATTNEELGRFTLAKGGHTFEVDADGYDGVITENDDLILNASGKLVSGGYPYGGAQKIIARALRTVNSTNNDKLLATSLI